MSSAQRNFRASWRFYCSCISIAIALSGFSACHPTNVPNADGEVGCPCDEAKLEDFNMNPDVPDIVERWAPVIFHDTDADDQSADLITAVDFDGNWLGADNAANRGRFPLPGVVYYSMARTATHTFLGYYFYHAKSNNGGHEHDFEGVVAALNNSTGQIEAVLANVHGPYVPYVSPWDVRHIKIKKKHQGGYRDQLDFSLLRRYPRSTGLPYAYDALAVGVEANTHAVWGRWHNKCVIGPQGSPSGCDDSHGGDGIIYVYKNAAEVPVAFNQYPNWTEYGYALRDVKDLWDKAQDPAFCGQSGNTAIFACQSRAPWDVFNSSGGDAGDLPWVWGTNQVIGHVCDGANILLTPAEIFLDWFEFLPDTFSMVYVYQPYTMSNPCP